VAALSAAPDRLRPGRERIARPAASADPRLDRPLAQLLAKRLGVVAAVGPELARAQRAGEQLVDQRQQVAPLVLVAGRQPDRQRGAVCVDR
jgi:hypothetical protein